MIDIDGRKIGNEHATFVIAEIGVNHDGQVDRAMELVHHAQACGADAVKLQIFSADTLMHPSASFAVYQQQRVAESNPAEMLRRFELTQSQTRRVISEIRRVGLIPIATPFSPADVRTIDALDLPAIKIASPDLVNRILLEAAAELGKPLLLSTGAATMDEVWQTVQWLGEWRTKFALMHCVSSYPTPTDQSHLRWISELAQFGAAVGYSDHAWEMLSGALAVASGACIVEKHLTYDCAAAGPDHSASADPPQFAQYVKMIRKADAMRGVTGKRVLPIEADVRRVSRQSLVLTRTVDAGQTINLSHFTIQRPGTGISPADAHRAAGRKAKSQLPAGTLLTWDMLSDAA